MHVLQGEGPQRQSGHFGVSTRSDRGVAGYRLHESPRTRGPSSTGIRKRHSKGCRSRGGGRCDCNAGWEASVFSQRDDKKIRKTFPAKAEARTWRADAAHSGSSAAPCAPRPSHASGGRRGVAARRGVRGDRQPLRAPLQALDPARLPAALEERVLPELGAAKLSAVTTTDLQALVDRWQAEGPRPPRFATRSSPYRRSTVEPSPEAGCR